MPLCRVNESLPRRGQQGASRGHETSREVTSKVREGEARQTCLYQLFYQMVGRAAAAAKPLFHVIGRSDFWPGVFKDKATGYFGFTESSVTLHRAIGPPRRQDGREEPVRDGPI